MLFEFVDKADAASFLAHVQENPPSFFVDLGQGGCQLFAAVAAAGTEGIAGQAFRMNTAEEIFAVADFSFDERHEFPVRSLI